MSRISASVLGLLLLAVEHRVDASVTSFNHDFEGWQEFAGPYTTCDFTGFPAFTVITDQYESLGVLFTNPTFNIVKNTPSNFPIDGWGLDANGYLELTFSQEMFAIGAHVPGSPKIQLFLGEVMIGQTTYAFGDGPSVFAGAASDIGFDRARFISPGINGEVYMDNLYFSSVPGPSVVAPLILAAARMRARRRR